MFKLYTYKIENAECWEDYHSDIVLSCEEFSNDEFRDICQEVLDKDPEMYSYDIAEYLTKHDLRFFRLSDISEFKASVTVDDHPDHPDCDYECEGCTLCNPRIL